MAVGRARQTGIEVPGLGILSAGKFEEHAGSKLHRPNQHTLAPSGKSLQDIMADSFEDGAGISSHHLPVKPVPTVPVMDDPNDDFCRVCGYGGDMLCCETCPATFHTECVGLSALPDGDWWCPQCVCAVCGQAHFESQAQPTTAKQVIWIDAEDTVASSTASASSARPMLQPPKPSAPAILPPNKDATPASITDAIVVNKTIHPDAAGTSAPASTTASQPTDDLPSDAAMSDATAAASSEQPDSVPTTTPHSDLVGADHTTGPFATTTVSNSAIVVGRDDGQQGKYLGVIGEVSGKLSDTPGLPSGVPVSRAPLQGALDSSTHTASTTMGLPVNASWQGKARLDQAAASGSQEGKKNDGELAAQTGPVLPGGSLGSVLQGKKRKVTEATGLPDSVPGPLGKKTKSNGSVPIPAVGGTRADASSMHEQLQRVAASAASPQAVQEALNTAFPPSQGSAKRAEKLKQFFSDVMPAGSGFKDRAAALTALASHLWQAGNKANPSGFQPNVPGRAVPTSPMPAIQSNAYSGSLKEQLQSIATTAAGITADIDAAAIAADKLSQQQASRVYYPGGADNPGDISTGVVDNLGAAPSTVADSSNQQASEPIDNLSEREHRMAARSGKLQQRAASSSSFEGKAGSLQGKPSGLTEVPVIPQSDGPADDDDMPDVDAAVGVGCIHDTDVSSSASALHQNTATHAATCRPGATVKESTGSAASKAATAAATPATASTSAVAPAQPSASALESMSPGLFSQPAFLPSQPPPGRHTVGTKDSTHQPSALEHMAARYLNFSSSARPQHSEPTHLADVSPQAAATSALDPVQESAPDLRSSRLQEVAQPPVPFSMPAHSSGLDDDVVAFSGQSADDPAPQQRSNVVHAATLIKGVLPNSQVVCPCSGRKHHFSCIPAQQQLQVVADEEVWFSSPQHRQLSAELTGVCCRGPLPCGQVDESTPVTWQLIRGAAVADSQSCRGYAPRYSASQKGHLRQVLFAARHILLDCFGRLDDSRTGEDTIPWMLQGRCVGNRLLDFSGFHVAVLWLAGVMASVALVRAFGPELAEVPLLATRHELQGNALAPLLLHQVEHTLCQAGVTCIIMPALPLPEAPLPNQAAPPFGTASGLKPWGSLVGYAMPSPAQLLEACRTSMLQLPGTPYLIKQLSADSVVKVKPFTQGLRLNPEADAEALAHCGMLIPYAAECAVKPEPLWDPEPHMNPEMTNEPSNDAQALPAPPEAGVTLERKSTGINGVTFSADKDAVVGVHGHKAKQLAEAAGLTSTDEPADTVAKDTDRQGKASASGQGLPESQGPNGMVITGDQPSAGKSQLGEMHSGRTFTTDADGIRETKRYKPAMPHSSTMDMQPRSRSASIAAVSGDSFHEDTSRAQPARRTVSRKSPSPGLTTKDGSSSSAAPIRSIATPSRVKVPKQQPTVPLT
ncbi:TPA: hypothetical protein ACH3X1_011698 [Trebouxia sp. C0004]